MRKFLFSLFTIAKENEATARKHNKSFYKIYKIAMLKVYFTKKNFTFYNLKRLQKNFWKE